MGISKRQQLLNATYDEQPLRQLQPILFIIFFVLVCSSVRLLCVSVCVCVLDCVYVYA